MKDPKPNRVTSPAVVQTSPGKPIQRWSAARKRDVVLRLVRGESIEAVSREVGLEPYHDADGDVLSVWTDPLPQQDVERVAPNEAIEGVTFGMEALADCARDATALRHALEMLPRQYADWISARADEIGEIKGARRQQTASGLVAAMRHAQARMEAGIALLVADPKARLAFAAMNEAVARAARQRESQANGKPPADQRKPTWRPFQLAFILLNLPGLADKRHPDREVVDLLFFPTGGGKTEAYLGLAAWTIAYRRLSVRETGRRRRGADALHASAADARPTRPSGRRGLCAGADARRSRMAEQRSANARHVAD
jgi:hypothetical protein